eukprot:scaffold107155_cov18-Tisochrysis_lutea.AAC.1
MVRSESTSDPPLPFPFLLRLLLGLEEPVAAAAAGLPLLLGLALLLLLVLVGSGRPDSCLVGGNCALVWNSDHGCVYGVPGPRLLGLKMASCRASNSSTEARCAASASACEQMVGRWQHLISFK